MRRAPAVALTAALVAALPVACTAATSPAPAGPASTALSTPTPPPTPVPSRPAAPASTARGTGTAAYAGPVVTQASADGTEFGLLRAVRLAGQDGADRIVFEFAAAVPGYRISYVDLPVMSDPADQPVAIAGSAALRISLMGSSAYATVGDAEPAYPVAKRMSGADTTQVTELVPLGDFERVMVWAAGVHTRAGFRVSTLDAPPRLVIDVVRA